MVAGKAKKPKKASKKAGLNAKAKVKEDNSVDVRSLRILFRKVFLASLMLVVAFVLVGFAWASIVEASSTLTGTFVVSYLILAGFWALYLGELFSSKDVKALRKRHGSIMKMLWKGFLE